ncbi:MAG: PP2C family protein-serine/threonine phosphatase [Anaerolineae bacterium]
MLALDVAVAKVAKYAVRESGDSVEVVERPRGGLSVVMADGQRSGTSAKAISNFVVRRAISLLAEGVRDGAVARAAHDALRTQRAGQVSAELTIISVDLETRTLVISRNSQCPVMVHHGPAAGGAGAWRALDEPAPSVGTAHRARPAIVELPLASGLTLVAFTDGVLHAGARKGRPLDIAAFLAGLPDGASCPAHDLADALLQAAVAADEGRPADDTTVVVARIHDAADDPLEVRRMTVSLPLHNG